MPYHWMSLRSAGGGDRKKISFIASSNGFVGEEGREIIKNRVRLLARLGFEVHFPVFVGSAPAQTDLVLDANNNSEQFDALTNLLVDPTIQAGSSTLLSSVSPAVSPQDGAKQICESIAAKRDIMPFLGGDSFADKLPEVKKYFAQHPEEKDPSVRIFGYSNASWASPLMIDGICSYVPTQYTAHFLRREELRKLRSEGKSDAYLEYVEQRANCLEECLTSGKIETLSRPVIYLPEALEEKEGFVMHYPLNSDVIMQPFTNPERFEFKPKAGESWSFGLEFMMQKGNEVSRFNQILSVTKEFLKSHKDNPPKFMEIGCIGSRLDGALGISDLIHDDKSGAVLVDDRNVNKILSKKGDLLKCLNQFLLGYSQLHDEDVLEKRDKEKHGELPEFLRGKSVIEDVNAEQVKELLKWQNEIRVRCLAELVEIAHEHNLPLFFNPRFGHVANMSPLHSGACKYQIQENGLVLESTTRDKCLIAPAASVTVTDFNVADSSKEKGRECE